MYGKSKSELVSELVTRSPIELFWTAKKYLLGRNNKAPNNNAWAKALSMHVFFVDILQNSKIVIILPGIEAP